MPPRSWSRTHRKLRAQATGRQSRTRTAIPTADNERARRAPPRICTNKESVSFGPEHGLKYGQKVPPYKTSEWRKLYHSPRNTIEGLNGLLKNDATAAFASPGRRRVRGRAAQTIFAALMIAAINVSKIRSYLRERASHDTDHSTTPRSKPSNDGRRRRHTLSEYSRSTTDGLASRAGPDRDS